MATLPISKCQLNPVGVASLRKILGTGDLYQTYQTKFDAADLAFFLAGAHSDGSHYFDSDKFHPWFHVSREHTPSGDEGTAAHAAFRDRLQDLVYDAITCWDRITGGATYMFHINGSLPPRTAFEVEELKIHAYAPPGLLKLFPNMQYTLAQIAQMFAEDARLRFGRQAPLPRTHRPAYRPVIVDPKEDTMHYVFVGCPVGEIDGAIAEARDHTTRRGDLTNPIEILSDDEADGDRTSLRDRIDELESLLDHRDAYVMRLEQEIIKLCRRLEHVHCESGSERTPRGQSQNREAKNVVSPLSAQTLPSHASASAATPQHLRLDYATAVAFTPPSSPTHSSTSRLSATPGGSSMPSSISSLTTSSYLASPSSEVVRIYSIGKLTDLVLQKRDVDPAAHNILWEIVCREADSNWMESIRLQLGVSHDVAEEIYDALDVDWSPRQR
ncbi:hypothetical protein A0H81_03871 [Grifola frondosa]|uniref:Uncharacterized protein n=1 Tax=Grifola frondosa TaxID=5627 RepID=A0A1C7MIG5_GRIFR|nr:hypothetical protein A0H81_03871 [Grifola frondosa]